MSAIYAFMASATTSLDMTMYELSDTEAESILEQDAARGVDVRVLLDADYHGGEVNQRAYALLGAHGVHVAWADGSTIFHQKTITVNGTESCIMTLNLTSRYYRTGRDLAVFDTNPADVAAIVDAFDRDFTGGPPSPGNPGVGDLVWSPGSTDALVNLINSATSSLEIESEELSDKRITSALVKAARRGVDVRIVMEASAKWDPAFDAIVAAGGHVGTYDNPDGFYIHAKFIDIDNSVVWIGSENFSVASLVYNRELGITLRDRTDAEEVTTMFDQDYANGTPYRG